MVLTGDPMLEMSNGTTVETTRPGRTFHGPVTFSIALARSQERPRAPSAQTGLPTSTAARAAPYSRRRP